MKAVFATAPLLLLAALAGCAGTGSSGADVARFHLGEPIARGQIAIEPFDTPESAGLEFQTYASAVAQELSRLGWTVVTTTGQSEQVALLGYEQSGYGPGRERGPVSVGIGGTTASYGSGVGAGISFDLGGKSTRNMVATMLQVRIKRRSDGTVFWEGRATGAARGDRPDGSPAVLAPRLASALFKGFPGESGRTIRVK